MTKATKKDRNRDIRRKPVKPKEEPLDLETGRVMDRQTSGQLELLRRAGYSEELLRAFLFLDDERKQVLLRGATNLLGEGGRRQKLAPITDITEWRNTHKKDLEEE